MVSSPKFYIYGGGKWREVDINDGRIEGRGRAQFAYIKRGKVRVAQTRPVLTALQDLAAGRSSAVRDGAPLPHRIFIPRKDIKPKTLKVDTGTQCVSKIDAGIQTSLPSQPLVFPDTLMKQNSQKKRRRQSASTEEDIPSTKTTTAAIVHTNSSSKQPKQQEHRSRTISSAESVKGSPRKIIPRIKLEKADSAKYNLYKRRRSKSSDSEVWVVLPKNKQNSNHSISKKRITDYLKPKSKRIVTKKRHESSSSNKTQKHKSRYEILSLEDHIDTNSSSYHRKQKEQTYETNSGDKSLATILISEKPRQYQSKELIIDEADVDVLRKYLMNHGTDFDVLKFDEDDEYKKNFFYKINPLVSVDRCPKIARKLREDSQEEISLKDFASQLGLKSVSDKPLLPNRYKMRKLAQRISYLDRDFSDSNTNKENSEPYIEKKSHNRSDNLSKQLHINNKDKLSASKRYATDTETEKSDEYFDKNFKKTMKVNSFFKEINYKRQEHKKRKISSSENYGTRKPGANKSYKESTGSSSDQNTDNSVSDYVRNSINKKSPDKLKKRRNKIISSKYGKRKFDNKRSDTDSSSSGDNTNVEDTTIYKEMIKRRHKTINNNKITNLTFTDSSDDYFDTKPQSSNETKQIKRNKIKGSKIDIPHSGGKNKNVNVSKSSKETKRKETKNKHDVNKRKSNSADSDDDFDVNETLNEINKRNHNKNNKKDAVGLAVDDLDDKNSDTKVPKSSKEIKKKRTGYNDNKSSVNKINNTADSDDNSDVNETSKERNRRGQNKTYNKKNYNQSESAEDSSDFEESKTAKEKKSRGQNKVVDSKRVKNLKDSNKDNTNVKGSKSSPELKNRDQNKVNNMKRKVELAYISDDNSVIEDSQLPKDKENHKSSRSNDKNNTNKRIHIQLTDSIKSNSDKKVPKSSRESNKIVKNNTDKETNKYEESQKKDMNNKKTNSSNGKKTDVEPPKLRKENDKSNKNKNNATDDIFVLDNNSKGNNLAKRPISLDFVSEESKPPTTKHVISKRASKSGAREYSNLEDHAIVTWLSQGGRARCVNGNRIWRDLQDQFSRIAGQKRSWHSLRNRYLRYILPSLGSLALPQVEVARLRAAAATGEIKSRKMTAQRNSIYSAASRGALSRRPRLSTSSSEEPKPPPKKHKYDNYRDVKSPSPKRALRSSIPFPSRDAPRYSDITRHFADTHRQEESTPTTSPTKKLGEAKKAESATKITATKNVSTSKETASEESSTRKEKTNQVSSARKEKTNQKSSARKEKTSREESSASKSSPMKSLSLRKSLRNKDWPGASTTITPVKSRTRKLFNPGAML